MRGTLKQRYEGSWSLILDLGYQIDPTTGRAKRKQKWITFRGTRKQAEAALTEHVRGSESWRVRRTIEVDAGRVAGRVAEESDHAAAEVTSYVRQLQAHHRGADRSEARWHPAASAEANRHRGVLR
jgi:hypothetical protein